MLDCKDWWSKVDMRKLIEMEIYEKSSEEVWGNCIKFYFDGRKDIWFSYVVLVFSFCILFC